MGKLIKNYIYNSLYQILAIIIPIITIPYVARALGAEGVGINGYILSVSMVFIYIGLLGLDKYASREIAYKRENKEELNKTFSELAILRLIMLVLTTIIYIIFSIYSEYKIYSLIQGIYVIGFLVDISWLYNGLENFKITALRSIIIKIINAVCIFIFIKEPSDLWKYIFINAFLLLVGNLVLYYNIKKYVQFTKVKSEGILKHVPQTIKIFIPQVAIQLYLQLGKIMIESITDNPTLVGYYDQADKIVKLPLALITALSTVMLPRISNEYHNNNTEKVKEYINKSLRFVFFLGIPIMFGLMGIANTLIPWFMGEEYIPVIATIQILSPVVIALCITNVIGDQYLMAINNTRVLTASYVIGAIVNFVFNWILISKYTYIGAAISMIITEIVIILIQIVNTNKIIDAKKLFKNISKYIISGLIMLVVVWLLGKIDLDLKIVTAIQVIVGVITYFILLLIQKDEFLNYILDKAKTMMKKI